MGAATAAGEGRVVKVLELPLPVQRARKLRDLDARPVAPEPSTGRPRWRTAAGLVLRANGYGFDVLADCIC